LVDINCFRIIPAALMGTQLIYKEILTQAKINAHYQCQCEPPDTLLAAIFARQLAMTVGTTTVAAKHFMPAADALRFHTC